MSACTRALFLSLFAAAVALGAAGCSFIPRDRAGAGETDLAPAEIDALAAAGRESYGRDPRERAAMDTAFAALARAARARAGDYELAW
ncbi:MAG: hypothetical protein HZA54_11435 [Planctomycetes bacterium]|nr:hypothetical protein [Planctomycetota bacterium]